VLVVGALFAAGLVGLGGVRGFAATVWSSPAVDLSVSPGTDAYDAQVAVSEDGTTAVAVWLRRCEFDFMVSQCAEGTHTIVQSKIATISGGTVTWSAVTDVTVDGVADFPQVGLSDDGVTAVAVWQRSNGSHSIVQSKSATISDGTVTWSAAATDLSATGEDAFNAQVVVSGGGASAVAVWQRFNGSNSIVQSKTATISDGTVTWPVDATNLSAIGADAYSAQVALSEDGTKASAIWVRENASYQGFVQSKTATISGATATWSTVATLSTGYSYNPQVALSGDGTTVIAVWHGNAFASVQSKTATINGGTVAWSAVANLTALSGGGVEMAQVAISENGTTAIAVWRHIAYFCVCSWIVQSKTATITAGTATWSDVATDLTEPGADEYGDPQVAFVFDPQVAVSDDGTKATAIWSRSDNGNSDRFVVQSTSATIAAGTPTWSAAATDVSPTGRNAWRAQMGLSGDGTTAIAVWELYVYADAGAYLVVQSANAPSSAGVVVEGFARPVDMGGVLNTAKAGSTIPLKFSATSGGEPISDPSSVTFSVTGVECGSVSTVTDAVEFTTTGSTTLRFDAASGQFIQNWKLPSTKNRCYRVDVSVLGAADALTAYVMTR
jgi:hypothetical protein